MEEINTNSDSPRVLVIEDDEDEYELVTEFLREQPSRFDLRWAPTLSIGLKELSQNQVDVILLDLFLPDSKGLDTFFQVKSKSLESPIVILSSLDDEDLAFEAIKKGAQDYLVKGQADGKRLARVLQYAIKRNELHKKDS